MGHVLLLDGCYLPRVNYCFYCKQNAFFTPGTRARKKVLDEIMAVHKLTVGALITTPTQSVFVLVLSFKYSKSCSVAAVGDRFL